MTIECIQSHEIMNVEKFTSWEHIYTLTHTSMSQCSSREDLQANVNSRSKICRKYIIINKKVEAILYVKMNKALYGLPRSSLLLYLKLVKDLEYFGF